jgi:hypothetical protein
MSDLLEDNVFCEIKMDSKTKEYKIGTPVRLDQIAFSSPFQYSLSPPVFEEKGRFTMESSSRFTKQSSKF